MKFTHVNGTNETAVKGPRAARFNPDEGARNGKPKKFKGGKKDFSNETECSHGFRHTLLAVTSLVNLTVPATTDNTTTQQTNVVTSRLL